MEVGKTDPRYAGMYNKLAKVADKRGKSHAVGYCTQDRHRWIHDRVIAASGMMTFHRQGFSVLDVGAGTGAFSASMKAAGLRFQYLGFEPSSKLVAKAESGVELINDRFSPFRVKSHFDFSFLIGVVCTIPDPWSLVQSVFAVTDYSLTVTFLTKGFYKGRLISFDLDEIVSRLSLLTDNITVVPHEETVVVLRKR